MQKKIALLLTVIFGISSWYLLFHSNSLGQGYYINHAGYTYIQSKTDDSVLILDVLDYAFNDKFIIAKRVPGTLIDCDGIIEFKFQKPLQYLLIDKINNETYVTHNKNRFYDELNTSKVSLDFYFSDEEIAKKITESKTVHQNDHLTQEQLRTCQPVKMPYHEL